MAIRSKDIYKGRRKKGSAGKVLAWFLVIVIVLAIALFFTLRAFTIYDDAGRATIVSPFSAEFRQYKQAQQEKAQASPSPSPSETPDPTATDPAVTDPDATDPSVTEPGTADPTAPVEPASPAE